MHVTRSAPSSLRALLHSSLVWLAACSLALAPLAAPVVALAAQPAPARATPAQEDEAEWLIMIYSAADDNVLEEDMMIDLQEAERVGSTEDVTIVVQTDRFDGAYTGMDDWNGAKRFLITQDDDMETLASTEVEDLGEVNMSDGATLVDFIEWAVTSYPAQKRMLILSDHGAGWPGGWGDPDPGGNGPDDVMLAEFFGDSLWLMEIDNALDEARANLGIDAFDVIGFDACLMAQLEVFTAIAPHAQYAVASEETEPGLGWSYAGFLGRLADDPGMDGADLATAIVETYIDEDLRLLDANYAGGLSPDVAATEIFYDVTLSAIDLSQIAPLNAALDNFAGAMTAIDQNIVAQARAYAQSYESVFGDELPSPYIDLGHFAQLVQSNTQDPNVIAAAEDLDAARAAAVIAERHGSARPGSTGIAFYFPVLDLYRAGNNLGYSEIAARFAAESQWDEFLAFHMGDSPAGPVGRPASAIQSALNELMPDLDPEYVRILEDAIAAMVEEGRTPEEIAQNLVDEWELDEEVAIALLEQGLLGAQEQALPTNTTQRKPIQISPITLSDEVAWPGEPVSIEANVSGDRIGFIYSFVGRLLPEDDILIIEDEDFLFADEETTVGGVTYPVWPTEEFTVGFDWEPYVYAISDGETSIRTLFSPETYGDDPTYTADGIYRFGDGSPDRYARLYFREGELTEVFGFTGNALTGSGAPREITPQVGDQFAVLEQGEYLGDDAPDKSYSAEVGTLTFGDQAFYIEETPAPSGNYVVGIMAEDLDGNLVESYEGLFVVGEDEVTEEGFVPLVDESLGFALLYPETWAPLDEGEDAGRVLLMTEDEAAQMLVTLYEFEEADDSTQASLLAIDDFVAGLQGDETLENVEVVDGPADFILGAFDAQMVDLAFEWEGEPYAAEIVAATPAPGQTYLVYFDAPAGQAEDLLPDFDAVLYSLDILISGIERAQPGALQPDLAEVFYADDYSDPESGLYDDPVAQDWGQGFYDPETEQYVYAMEAASGAIYDSYVDWTLDDSFLLQVTALTAGAVDTSYGLTFQVTDLDSFYAFTVSGDGYFMVERSDGGAFETLIDWTEAIPLDTQEEAPNTLAVAGDGGTYRLFINNEQVAEFSDDTYSGGSVGYVVENFDAEAPAAFVFDDLIVGAPAE